MANCELFDEQSQTSLSLHNEFNNFFPYDILIIYTNTEKFLKYKIVNAETTSNLKFRHRKRNNVLWLFKKRMR